MLSPMVAYTSRIIMQVIPARVIEETMAGAQKGEDGNAPLEDHRFLEIHLPVREVY